MKLSIVIALMNEEPNIVPLLEHLRQSLDGLLEYEVILVDDGSSDGTVVAIKQHADERVKLVVFYRNYGQTSALSAGIQEAQGEYIATMDGDLQNDPTDIPAMIAELERGNWDVVAGRRANRQDAALLRKFPSRIANWLIRRMTGVHVSDYGCTLKVFRRQIAKSLGLYGELHRFIPILAALQGARLTEVDVTHHPRRFGRSKYGLGRTTKVMSDLLLMLFLQRYGQKPMHLFGPIGLLSFGAGTLVLAYLLVVKIMGEDIGGRPLLLTGITLLLGGIQLITSGFLAELLVRTYFESQQKRPYHIREVYVKPLAEPLAPVQPVRVTSEV